MHRISWSLRTFFLKKVLPWVWFGLLGLFLIAMLGSGEVRRNPWVLALAAVTLAIGCVVTRRMGRLADEVFDGGEFLQARKGNVEERVELADVANVSAKVFSGSGRITLRLHQPGRLGREIVFIPHMSFRLNPLAPHPLAESLTQRVHHARANA